MLLVTELVKDTSICQIFGRESVCHDSEGTAAGVNFPRRQWHDHSQIGDAKRELFYKCTIIKYKCLAGGDKYCILKIKFSDRVI